MKKTKLLALMLAFLAGMGGMTSCSNDEDAENEEKGGNEITLSTPKYEKDAQKLEIKGSSEFQSIELTSSGNYIITTQSSNDNFTRSGKVSKKSVFAATWKSTRAANIVYGNIIFGSYTKNDDGSYNLEGFGTINIVADSEGDAVVTMKRNGKSETLHASVVSQKMSGTLTDKLCRTWKFAGLRTILTVEGKTLIDAKGNTVQEYMTNLQAQAKKHGLDLEDMDVDYDVDEAPEDVIFTKSGTYVVTYVNKEVGVAFWKWKSEQNQTIYYAWDNNFLYAGDCKLEFTANGYLNIIEQEDSFDEEDEDDENFSLKMITILKGI